MGPKKRPPRVLRIIGRMNVGGPAHQIVNLESGLSALDYNTRLVAGALDDGEEDYLALYGSHINVSRLNLLQRKPDATSDALAYRAIARELRLFRPDIVHTHTAKAGVLGRLAAISAGVPHLVHTFHGHLLQGYFGPVGRWGVVAMERWLAQRTSVLCAVGDRVRSDLLQAGIGAVNQYQVVPPGVRPPKRHTRKESRATLNLPPDAPVVAYVGRLTRVKRPDRLLEAAAAVFRSRPDCHFVVAGAGELLEETSVASRQLKGQVHFLGWTRDVASVYAAADITVLVSDNEGMPVSLIESSMAGTPAVTTDVGSAGEVVLHEATGLVVARDAGATAQSVLRLIGDDTLRRRLGQAAHEYATKAFSVRRLVEATDSMYQALLSEERPPKR